MIIRQYIAYTKLFDFRLFHGFYLDYYQMDGTLSRFVNLPDADKRERIAAQPYDIHSDFDILPVNGTDEMLRNYKMTFRKSPLGFYLGAKVNTTEFDDGSVESQLFIPLEQPLQFSFALFLKKRHFLNFSELTLEGQRRHAYFFSNRSSQAGNGANIGVGELNYNVVGPSSRLRLFREKLQYSFGPLAGVTMARLTVSDAYTQEVLIQEAVQAPIGQHLEQYSLGLSRLDNGLYAAKIEVLAPSPSQETFDFYKYSGPSFEPPFGIVEIAAAPFTSPFFNSLDGQVLAPWLNLYVDNRKTNWRYFSSMQPDVLIMASSGEKHLARHGYSSLSFNGKQLPNPSEKALTAQSDGYYSDTFL